MLMLPMFETPALKLTITLIIVFQIGGSYNNLIIYILHTNVLKFCNCYTWKR